MAVAAVSKPVKTQEFLTVLKKYLCGVSESIVLS
jgi:hypothetical protein